MDCRETPPARPCGKLAPHAFRAARNFELFAPPPGKPDGGPPAGGEPEPPAGAPEGGLPAPGVPDGRVTPCWRRQVASAVRLVADPVVAADVEFVLLELLLLELVLLEPHAAKAMLARTMPSASGPRLGLLMFVVTAERVLS